MRTAPTSRPRRSRSPLLLLPNLPPSQLPPVQLLLSLLPNQTQRVCETTKKKSDITYHITILFLTFFLFSHIHITTLIPSYSFSITNSIAAPAKPAENKPTGNSANQVVKPGPPRDANQNLQEREKETRAPRDKRDRPARPADDSKRPFDRKSGTGRM